MKKAQEKKPITTEIKIKTNSGNGVVRPRRDPLLCRRQHRDGGYVDDLLGTSFCFAAQSKPADADKTRCILSVLPTPRLPQVSASKTPARQTVTILFARLLFCKCWERIRHRCVLCNIFIPAHPKTLGQRQGQAGGVLSRRIRVSPDRRNGTASPQGGSTAAAEAPAADPRRRRRRRRSRRHATEATSSATDADRTPVAAHRAATSTHPRVSPVPSTGQPRWRRHQHQQDHVPPRAAAARAVEWARGGTPASPTAPTRRRQQTVFERLHPDPSLRVGLRSPFSARSGSPSPGPPQPTPQTRSSRVRASGAATRDPILPGRAAVEAAATRRALRLRGSRYVG